MRKFFLFTVLILFLFSCNRNNLDIDVSDISVDLQIYRYDVEMFNLSGDSIYYAMPKLQKKYGEFFDIYNTRIIKIGLPDNKDFYKNLNEFYSYCDQSGLYNEIVKVFPNNDKFIEKRLTNAFKHYKYYFPKKNIPKIITCLSGFNLSVFTGSNFIGISLDKYLGKNFKPYKGMFDKYLIRRMTKDMIPVDVMRAWAMAEYPFNDSLNTVLTNMIYEGRVQYFLDAMLPQTPDTLKWGYKYLQLGWAREYEERIWEYMINQEVLFSNDDMTIKTYTGEAPFTTPFQHNSAPRAGTFVGYKIVKSFLKNNPEVNLKKLMNIKDYMYIYNNSFYEP